MTLCPFSQAQDRPGSVDPTLLSKKTGEGSRLALRILPYLILSLTAILVFAETTEDPFITFHYAKNILLDNGPVFNVGQRVEGFTSPAHLLLCVALMKILPSVGMLIKAKAASLVFGFIYVAQTAVLARTTNLSAKNVCLAQCLVALNINFAIASVNGLETTLFGVFLLWVMRVFMAERDAGLGIRSALILAASVLIRPEALAIFGLLAVCRARDVMKGKYPRRHAIRWAGIFLLLVACIEFIRLSYYGLVLPNTFYAKNAPMGLAITDGIAYLFHPLLPIRIHGFLPGQSRMPQIVQLGLAAMFWGLIVLGFLSRGFKNAAAPAGCVVAAIVFAVLRAGGDWMFGWRFVVPALSILAVAQVHGLNFLSANLKTCMPKRTAIFLPALPASAITAVWIFALLSAPKDPWWEAGWTTGDASLLSQSLSGYGSLWVRTARYFNEHVSPGATIAYSEMGYGPYTNMNKRFIDMRGLTDPTIARLPPQMKSCVGVTAGDIAGSGRSFFFMLDARRPDFIVDIDPDHVTHGEPVILGNYRLAATVDDGVAPPSISRHAAIYIRDSSTGAKANGS